MATWILKSKDGTLDRCGWSQRESQKVARAMTTKGSVAHMAESWGQYTKLINLNLDQ